MHMGLFMELWKLLGGANRNGTSRRTVRPKVEKHLTVADETVVAKNNL